VSISDDCIVWYFEGKPTPCGKCGAEIDLWTAACRDPASLARDLQSMPEALEAYSQQRYAPMIVAANTAVESCLSEFLGSRLPSLVSKSRPDDLPAAAASYAHQLHVLLPLIAHYNGIPQLPPPVRGALDKLRAFRNDLAHGGVAAPALDAHAAAELLCGALFGLHYVRYVEARL
jgi:hypothetical protein